MKAVNKKTTQLLPPRISMNHFNIIIKYLTILRRKRNYLKSKIIRREPLLDKDFSAIEQTATRASPT